MRAALSHQEFGLIDNWLRSLKGIHYQYLDKFDNLNIDEQTDLLCELNVKRQVTNVCHTTIVQNAWHRGQKLSVHGWIYGLKDGLIHDLRISVSDFSQPKDAFVYEM